MRSARDREGKKLFSPPYPTEQQIDSFFTRHYAQIKKGRISEQNDESEEIEIINQERHTEEQIIANEQRNEELLTLIENDDTGSSSDHPLEENRMNLCEIAMNYLANKGNQKKLFLADYSIQDVHSVFRKLNRTLPRIPTSYRALAKEICKYVTETCPEKCCNL